MTNDENNIPNLLEGIFSMLSPTGEIKPGDLVRRKFGGNPLKRLKTLGLVLKTYEKWNMPYCLVEWYGKGEIREEIFKSELLKIEQTK